jgi:hypothetical protein
VRKGTRPALLEPRAMEEERRGPDKISPWAQGWNREGQACTFGPSGGEAWPLPVWGWTAA